MEAQPNIAKLLLALESTETGRSLMEWASAIPGRIVAGEMMIGILSVEEVRKVPTALHKAAECGLGGALILLARWFAKPPLANESSRMREWTLQIRESVGL